jgi:16S rRNA (guanine527-N7)-methyltransferase
LTATGDGSAVAARVYSFEFDRISRYVDILAGDGVTRGLIGPRETARLWDRHILNSAALSELVPPEAAVLDVGSGAGLPGIPLAVRRPDLAITLLEPLLRRSVFLTEVVGRLGLTDRVTVVRGRAEEYQGAYSVVTARAVAPLGRLITWCAHLRADDGIILALKGQSAADEVTAASDQLTKAKLMAEVLRVRAHPDAEPATVVRLRSIAP